MSTPAHSLRLILALIFTAAAIPKILDPAAFTQSVAGTSFCRTRWSGSRF